MDFKIRAELLGRTEAEIRQEMASALGRIGQKLETLVSELVYIRNYIASCPDSEKERNIQKYEHTEKEARLYYWYLIIQRESIGLRSHELLQDLYPIPSLP